MTIRQIYIYIYTYEQSLGKKMTKKRKTHPPLGDDASTVRYSQGRVGERGEARPAIRAPNGGPHLDLGALRLKTWSKSDFSIAKTTSPTYLYTYKGSPSGCG